MLFRSLNATDIGSGDALTPYIIRAIDTIAEACERHPSTPIPDWLAHASEEIEAKTVDGVSVQDMARQLGLHPVSLARAFRHHHACSITEYLRRKRIVQASRRIAAGADSLADLAIESGFADQPHFTRAFRAELGCTPGEFRRLVS